MSATIVDVESRQIASLIDFLPTHNNYLSALSEIVVRGDCALLDEWWSPHYQLISCDRASNQISILERDGALTRVRNAIINVRGGFHRAGGRVIRPRGQFEMVVTFETQLGTRMQTQSAMTTQTWRIVDERWWLMREMVERNTDSPEIVIGATHSSEISAFPERLAP